MKILWNILLFLHIIECCPNHHKENYCVLCGNNKGEVTNWIWGCLIDPSGKLTEKNMRKQIVLLKNYMRTLYDNNFPVH